MKALLILVVGIGLASVIVTILVGTTTFDGTVENDPYEAGLQWDAKQRDRRESGWSVSLETRSISVGGNELRVSIADRQGRPLSAVSVALMLASSSSSRYDHVYAMERVRDGIFQGAVEIPRRGTWYVRILVTQGRTTITFEDVLYTR
jgi:nitrogen fixation protein FixH